MKSLSIWTYYLHNKRKIVPVLVIIIISIIGLVTPPALFKSVKQEIVDGIQIYNYYSVVFFNEAENPNISRENFYKQLADTPGVDHVLESQIRYTQRYAISSDIDTPVFFIDSKDYDKALSQFNLSLFEGSLPKDNTNEVALTTKLAKNKNLKIGDKFGYSIDPNDTIPGEYLVSGLLKADVASLGIGNLGFVNQKRSPLTNFLVAPKPNQSDTVDIELSKLKTTISSFSFENYNSLFNRMNYGYGSLDLVFNIIILIIVTVISTSIALLQIIFFMQRANEYGLFAAIGYTRSFIIKKSIFEVTILIIFGWIIGLFVTLMVFTFINNSLYIPKAYVPLNMFDPEIIKYSLPIPIVISVFSVIPILWQLIKMDPISIIERRD